MNDVQTASGEGTFSKLMNQLKLFLVAKCQIATPTSSDRPPNTIDIAQALTTARLIRRPLPAAVDGSGDCAATAPSRSCPAGTAPTFVSPSARFRWFAAAAGSGRFACPLSICWASSAAIVFPIANAVIER